MIEKSLIQTITIWHQDMENLASMLANNLKEQKEIFQEMKVSMVDSINHLEKTINRMVEVVRDVKSREEKSCVGNAQQSVEQSIPLKRSTKSPLKRGRAQTVPVKCKRYPSRIKKQGWWGGIRSFWWG
ncbi:hypothetical protein Rs2_20972 [Raphanus sativus]|nr:hypothetical protein Rs2_20972 [Raphanus sativus]